MAETLTEVDSFDATIQMPTGGETASASDLRDKAIQRLTNRTRNLKNRADDFEPLVDQVPDKVTAGVARYTVDSLAVYSPGDSMAITLDRADTGYSLTGGITVQVPAKGWYWASASMMVSLSSVTDGATAEIQIRVGGSAKSRSTVMRAGTSGIVGLATSVALWVETPATDTITIYANPGTGTMTTVATATNHLSIARVGAPA